MQSYRNSARSRLAALAAIGVFGLVSSSHATEGYFSHAWGTEGKGLAGACLAYVEGTLSGAANPASVAFVGKEFDVGLDVFMPYRHYDAASASAGFPIEPGRVNSTEDIFLIPSMGFNIPMKDGASSFALLFYGNGGMNTNYKSGVFGAGPAGVNLEQAFFAPTYARKVGPSTSVGVGLLLCYQEFSANGLANFAGFSSDPTHLSDRGNDQSEGIGVRLGVLHNVNDKLSVAASWQPKIS
ncbi:MAG TPA: hypothetical protein VMI31_02615, partial [Fimbriimonadaceae bacterium]|nr:hypothetical protein [Fimbriimonadaceae bacterium]